MRWIIRYSLKFRFVMLALAALTSALSLLEVSRVEVVTGVNLPMLIKFTNLRERLDPSVVAAGLADEGRRAINVASSLLEGESETAVDAEQ